MKIFECCHLVFFPHCAVSSCDDSVETIDLRDGRLDFLKTMVLVLEICLPFSNVFVYECMIVQNDVDSAVFDQVSQSLCMMYGDLIGNDVPAF